MVSTFVSEKALARTYDGEAGWQTVTQYREATRLREENPDMARAEIARRVNRSASAVRGWLAEGKVPAVVKGLRTANERGWIEVDTDSERFRALNLLVAWVYSGGGIDADRFAPGFSVDDPLTLSTLTHLFRWLNISYRCRIPEDPDPHREVFPKDGASVLGRVLSVLGAPVGVKAELDDLALPPYFSTVDDAHGRDFIRIYLLNRGGPFDGKAGTSVHSPSQTFRDELATLVESVTDGSATVAAENDVWVSADAVRDVAGGTPIPSALATRALHGTLSPPTDRAFASTYRQHETPGGYRYAQLYRKVRASERSPKELADEYQLSAPTVYTWRRETKPYAQRGLDRAFEHGWITPDADSETAIGLTGLLAWVLAYGRLRETFWPIFGCESDTQRDRFETIAAAVGVPWSVYRDESVYFSTELRPSENGSALGRVLYALGAPRHNDSFDEPLIPPSIFHYPAHARQFVQIWGLHHATTQDPLTLTVPHQFSDQLPDAFETLMTNTLCLTVDRTGERELVADVDISS